MKFRTIKSIFLITTLLMTSLASAGEYIMKLDDFTCSPIPEDRSISSMYQLLKNEDPDCTVTLIDNRSVYSISCPKPQYFIVAKKMKDCQSYAKDQKAAIERVPTTKINQITPDGGCLPGSKIGGSLRQMFKMANLMDAPCSISAMGETVVSKISCKNDTYYFTEGSMEQCLSASKILKSAHEKQRR
jgi:hypothetical protein